MPRLIFLVLILLSLNSYAQKIIDTLNGADYNNRPWFKESKKWDKKMGLTDLLEAKDSLHIRFRDGFNIVDIIINKKGGIRSNQYSYLFKLSKKNKVQKIIYKKISIDKALVSKILDTLNKSGIPDFYDGYKIPGYPVTVDGVTYIFEFSTPKSYKCISFAGPSAALDLKEGRAIVYFEKYLYEILNLKNNFNNLKTTLSKGKYRIGGMWLYKVF